MIWWIIFFSVLPIGIQSNKEVFKEKIGGMDPGAPKNPKIGKKFLITTLITTIIFFVIYYLVNIDLLNLRELLKQCIFQNYLFLLLKIFRQRQK